MEILRRHIEDTMLYFICGRFIEQKKRAKICEGE